MTAIVALWWGLCLALLMGSAGLALLQPGLARRQARAPDQEPVSMLIPVKGQAPGFSEASLSALRQDHAALEILFSAAGTDEAGAAAVRAVLAAAPPGKALRFVRTAPAAGLNPKIGNLLEPYAAASHDIVVIKDATTLLAPGQVGAMLRSLTPGTGLVCAAPIARAPVGFTAHVEAALINTYGARLLLAASVIGVGVGIGAAMLLRRSDLDRAGGLAAIAPAVADDHAISKALAGLGLRTAFTAETVDQVLGRRAAASVWGRHLRWALCRRTTEPLAFWLEPMTGLIATCLAAWLAFASSALLAATVLAWVVVEIGLALAKGWPAGPLSPPAILLREALLPVLWLAALGTRTIAWGEQAVPLSSGAPAVKLALVDTFGLAAGLFLAVLLANHLRLAWQARRPSGWYLAAALPLTRMASAPAVLLQIPVYNEASVLAAALRSAVGLDWPAERLTIQILDDSSDGAADHAAALIAALPPGGPRVEQLRRAARTGYKAGALAQGLARSQAPFVAMLDADFRAPADWLRRAIGVLEAAPQAAFVQFRFEFSNRAQNWMTRAQQLSVDAHFLAEQAGRAAGREPFQFNGTGGVWRRSAIDAVGGWSSDTLAEDLDLAMRAFAAGFEARLVIDPPLSCEAPADIGAWRTQQERWSAGFVQVALKAAPSVWRAGWPSLVRASTLLLLGLQLALPSFLVAVAAFLLDGAVRGFRLFHAVIAAGAGLTALLALLAITAPPFFRLRRGGPVHYLAALVALPSLLIYMALANSVAVLAAPFRKSRVFIRTPKSGQG